MNTDTINPNNLFDKWYNGESLNINKFTKKLFELYCLADGSNRIKLKHSYPEYFSDSKTFS